MNKQSQESENFGCEQILNTFSSVFSDVRVMQNIIMPMDGFGYCPTAEFDVIVSCNAGVFVFEIKGYTGKSIEIFKTEKRDKIPNLLFFCFGNLYSFLSTCFLRML